jgi:hypothetical protein
MKEFQLSTEERPMSNDTLAKAKLTAVAELPPGFFLENIAGGKDRRGNVSRFPVGR